MACAVTLSEWMHTEILDTFIIVKQWTVHPIDHSFCSHCMIRCFSHCFVLCRYSLLSSLDASKLCTPNSTGICCCFTRDDNASFKPTENYRLFWVFHFHQLSCIRKAKYLYPCRFPVRKGCFVCDRVLMDF